jgi:hypothetical protein
MASPAEMARRYGPEIPVADWHKRLVCSRCGSRDTDMGCNWRAAVMWGAVWGASERAGGGEMLFDDDFVVSLSQDDPYDAMLKVLQSDLIRMLFPKTLT